MRKYDYRDIRWEWENPRKERDNMNVNAMFPSKHLKAADLQGQEHRVVMRGMDQQEVGPDKDKKWVLHFDGKDRGLVLNVTNANMIAEFYGEETDAWVGKEIILYMEKVPFGNKIVDAIRVKVEKPAIPPMPPSPEAEDIPF